MNAAAKYTQVRNETASKEQIMVLLFETAPKYMRAGPTALEHGKFTDAVVMLTKASDIVAELDNTLDRGKAPELCDRLHDIYLFVAQRLAGTLTARNPTRAREAERVFAPIATAFSEAVTSLGVGQ